MKKRDYYFLGLLICIVAYAASHRSNGEEINQIRKQSINESSSTIEHQQAKKDSLRANTDLLYKAGA